MTTTLVKEIQNHDSDTVVGWMSSQSKEFFYQWGAGAVFDYPLQKRQLQNHFETSRGDSLIRKIYKAVDIKTEKMVGYIELNNINVRDKNAVVSRVLVDPSLANKGIGQQMVKQVLRIGFQERGLHRISLLVFDFNKPAIACYERAGFVREDIIRDYIRVDETYWSCIQMSILEHEWLHSGINFK